MILDSYEQQRFRSNDMQLNSSESLELFLRRMDSAEGREAAIKPLERFIEGQGPEAGKAAYVLGALHLTVLPHNVLRELNSPNELDDIQRDRFNIGIAWLKKAETLGYEQATLLLAKICLLEDVFPLSIDRIELGMVITDKIRRVKPDFSPTSLQKIGLKNKEAMELLNKYALEYLNDLNTKLENPDFDTVTTDTSPSIASHKLDTLEKNVWRARYTNCQKFLQWAEDAIKLGCSNAASPKDIELMRFRLLNYIELFTQKPLKTFDDLIRIRIEFVSKVVAKDYLYLFTNFSAEMENIKQEIAFLNKLENLFDDTTTIKLLNEVCNAVNNIYLTAERNGKFKLLFEDIANNPASWILTTINPFDNDKHSMLLPSLSECACQNDNFNRVVNNRRATIESEIIKFIKSRFPQKRDQVIDYLSVGSGGLLQDFILIIKLMLLGYSVNISLIGSEYTMHFQEKIDKEHIITKEKYLELSSDRTKSEVPVYLEKSKALKQFEILLSAAKEFNIKIVVDVYETIDEFTKLVKTPQDVITAIDHDQFYRKDFKHTIKAHQRLHPEGKMFLSFGAEDYTFSNISCVKNSSEKSVNEYVNKLSMRVSTQLRIAVLEVDRLRHTINNTVIPYIISQSGIKKVILTIPHPQKFDYIGSPKGINKPNLNISKESYQYFISLFLPRDVELQLNYVTGHQNFEQLLPQFDSNQDLVICYGRGYTLGIKELFRELETLHAKFPQSDFVCAMHAFSTGRSVNTPFVSFQNEWIWNSTKQKIKLLSNEDRVANAALIRFYDNRAASQNSEETGFKPSIL